MPTYAAFLRAINLGANRKFPAAAIKAAVEAAGMSDVETYINTGNVRLTTPLRSRPKIEAVLEKAFRDDRGFEVPTYVFTPAELVAIAETGDRLWAEHGEPRAHYVTMFKQPPPAAAVEGRTAHVLMHGSFRESRAQASRLFTNLGQGTARTITVIRTLARRWG